MPFDRGALSRVACLFAAGCAPVVRPAAPPATPASPEAVYAPRPAEVATPGRQILLGEMCPQAADGRPAIAPLVMRGVQWTDTTADVVERVERGSVPRFLVFGADGRQAGVFDTLGVVDIAPQQSVATGTYVGASPCTYEVAPTQRGARMIDRAEDAACHQATSGCGLAVGELERPDDPPEIPAYAIGGACIANGKLVVDIDGDGRPEAFPLTGMLDGIRGPAQEWSAAAAGPGGTGCKPRFTLFGVPLAPATDPGQAVDQKAVVTVDVLGVVDLDGDGRRELVMAMKFPTVRSVVVYSATETPDRLALVGEAPSFAR